LLSEIQPAEDEKSRIIILTTDGSLGLCGACQVIEQWHSVLVNTFKGVKSEKKSFSRSWSIKETQNMQQNLTKRISRNLFKKDDKPESEKSAKKSKLSSSTSNSPNSPSGGSVRKKNPKSFKENIFITNGRQWNIRIRVYHLLLRR